MGAVITCLSKDSQEDVGRGSVAKHRETVVFKIWVRFNGGMFWRNIVWAQFRNLRTEAASWRWRRLPAMILATREEVLYHVLLNRFS
jgi:hypothetical protein